MTRCLSDRLWALTIGIALALASVQGSELAVASLGETVAGDPAVTTTYAVEHPRGLMVTSGGWAYCQQVRKLARRTGYTLLCGRFSKDGYRGVGLRSKRHVDWGNPGYLASLARKTRAVYRRVGGELLLIGVSYSGFGVATLASHHPELRPDRLIVIDSYLDLVARRRHAPDSYPTAKEIDQETGGSPAALRERSVSVQGLARLVRSGTRVVVIWSVSSAERTRYRGATCDRTANAASLSRLAVTLGRSVPAWVTQGRHGTDLWHFGASIVAGHYPGEKVTFERNGAIPDPAVC